MPPKKDDKKAPAKAVAAAPKAKTTGNLAGKRVKAVTVSQAGDLYLDAYPVTPEQLEERLLQLKAANPAQPIVVKGDAHAQYARVMLVLEILKRTDISNIGLVTSRVI